MATKRECGVCWYVYDPDLGDDVWQVPPGTAFEALPPEWRCPRCDSGKERFLPPRDEGIDPRVAKLEQAYRHIAETKMKDFPLSNPKLDVKAVGFRSVDQGLLGVLVTPWGINAVLFPDGGATAPPLGHTRTFASGRYTFLRQALEGVGELELMSLLSPVTELEDQQAAVVLADEMLEAILAPPKPALTSRRAWLKFLPRSTG